MVPELVILASLNMAQIGEEKVIESKEYLKINEGEEYLKLSKVSEFIILTPLSKGELGTLSLELIKTGNHSDVTPPKGFELPHSSS